jgi:hypothetical protein
MSRRFISTTLRPQTPCYVLEREPYVSQFGLFCFVGPSHANALEELKFFRGRA